MVLVLTPQQISAISAHAERVYPEECCGLMVGKIEAAPIHRHESLLESLSSDVDRLSSEAAALPALISPALPALKSVYKVLVEIVPLENHWLSEADANLPSNSVWNETSLDETAFYTRRRRYAIDPKDMLRVQKQARDQGLNIIGVYHSHPDQAAVPSECDHSQAWPEYAYVIVSVQASQKDLNNGSKNSGKAVDIQNWALDSDHQFQPEAIKIFPSSVRDRMPVSA